MRKPICTLALLSVVGLAPVALAATVKTQAPAPVAEAPQGVTEIKMFIGELKTIPAGKLDRVAIGNGAIVSTRALETGELLLLAEKEGDTSMMLWSGKGPRRQYIVRVVTRDSQGAYQAAASMLKDVPGLKLSQIGGNVVISGTASKTDLERIALVAKLYPQVVSLVSAEDVSMKKMIYFKVQVVEMKRSLLENLGVQWPGSMAGPSVGFLGNWGSENRTGIQAPIQGILPIQTGNRGLRTYLGISSLLNTTINIAKNNGDAYILAEPELSARSGGEARFLAGGQFPIRVAGALGSTSIEYKDYGIKLTIKPVADDQGNVSAAVDTEVSSIDSSVSVDGAPGLLSRKTSTDINVRNGQTIALSGLINSEMSKDISRVPGLGSIPVIGQLFRSDNFRNSRTDLVILVTPTVIDPASTLNRERIEKSDGMRERFERSVGKSEILD
ncbi:pilus assembly protein N-terminal domain-containing protein [Chitinimonas viridis]|uniref:Pilus assembly protein N-terminal domain-containing protein n=1 Tax=Chitinimonas viridis TaxID=664880 RepID=A0ABT8B9N7_9NEIS|nr:pilus assembly protein N-terminal domain-containing protein [Chitinimonas viridis]MDN3578964.1 pilus assembly protein N-terminal domain-containing protein [Chitinimonas viridis]